MGETVTVFSKETAGTKQSEDAFKIHLRFVHMHVTKVDGRGNYKCMFAKSENQNMSNSPKKKIIRKN